MSFQFEYQLTSTRPLIFYSSRIGDGKRFDIFLEERAPVILLRGSIGNSIHNSVNSKSKF